MWPPCCPQEGVKGIPRNTGHSTRVEPVHAVLQRHGKPLLSKPVFGSWAYLFSSRWRTRATLYSEFLGFWTRSSSSNLVENLVFLFFWISSEGTQLNRQAHVFAQCRARNCGVFSSFSCDSPSRQCSLQPLDVGIDAVLD